MVARRVEQEDRRGRSFETSRLSTHRSYRGEPVSNPSGQPTRLATRQRRAMKASMMLRDIGCTRVACFIQSAGVTTTTLSRIRVSALMKNRPNPTPDRRLLRSRKNPGAACIPRRWYNTEHRPQRDRLRHARTNVLRSRREDPGAPKSDVLRRRATPPQRWRQRRRGLESAPGRHSHPAAQPVSASP